MMKKAIGEEPKMWGSSIIGFGNVHSLPVLGLKELKFHLKEFLILLTMS
jgi:hypothetical protein